jgi:putative intracellular protease/amidase
MTSIGMPVYDSVDMLDVTGPYEMFRWAKIDADVVAEKSGPHKFRDAFSFQVDKTFKQAGNKYDALWVPGGDPPMLSNHQRQRRLPELPPGPGKERAVRLLGVRRRDASRWRGPARWL